MPRDELRDAHRTLTALPFERHVPRNLHAALFDVRHARDDKARAQLRSDRHGRRETHAIEPVIDAHALLETKRIDQQLGLGLTLPAQFQARFVWRNVALCALLGAAQLRYFYVFEQWRVRERAEENAREQADMDSIGLMRARLGGAIA